jgi:thiamine pyrophosphokinase
MRYYRDMAVEGVMFTDHGFFTPAQGLRTFVSEPRQQVSIFNFGCTSIQSEGLRWNSYAYKEWWQGTLNEALATTFTLRSDGFYMVYQTYDTKQG